MLSGALMLAASQAPLGFRVMVRRSLALLLVSASLVSAGPAFAQSKSLMEYLNARKVERQADQDAPKGKKVKQAEKTKGNKKLSAKEKAAQAKAETVARRKGGALPGVAMGAAPQADAATVARAGNNGELRSELAPRRAPSLLANLFGGAGAAAAEPAMLPQTQALDAVLAKKDENRKFRVKEDFVPQEVEFSGYKRGQIVINTKTRYLYLVESGSTARRYAIAVGREGLLFTGKATVGDKQEWPRWIPTADMQKREPRKYGQYKDGMPGGPENPLGARAIYLYQGKQDTHIRIHGTNQPQTIGSASSNGCFRMVNEHVMDLYRRVPMGAEVIVL